jgi:Na+/H+-dicarboxylate symporter
MPIEETALLMAVHPFVGEVKTRINLLGALQTAAINFSTRVRCMATVL